MPSDSVQSIVSAELANLAKMHMDQACEDSPNTSILRGEAGGEASRTAHIVARQGACNQAKDPRSTQYDRSIGQG